MKSLPFIPRIRRNNSHEKSSFPNILYILYAGVHTAYIESKYVYKTHGIVRLFTTSRTRNNTFGRTDDDGDGPCAHDDGDGALRLAGIRRVWAVRPGAALSRAACLPPGHTRRSGRQDARRPVQLLCAATAT